MKKYMDIERLKDKYASAFVPGEHITVTEKIDGANASITYNPEDDCIDAFSRRNKLGFDLTLEGFYNFSQTLDKGIIKAATEDGKYIIFGEWLVKHSIKYPESFMKQFYVFDVYNTETQEYMPWEITLQIAEFCGLKTVPLFYDGKFQSWEHVNTFLGKTDMEAEPTGEGIVIKSQDRLDNKSSKTPCYVKIVTKEFSEVHNPKKEYKEVDPEKLQKMQKDFETVGTIVTKRRVEKILQKFVEDEIIPRDYDEHNFGQIAKILPKALYEDCVKEEPETVYSVDNFGKICAKIAMQLVREMVQ